MCKCLRQRRAYLRRRRDQNGHVVFCIVAAISSSVIRRFIAQGGTNLKYAINPSTAQRHTLTVLSITKHTRAFAYFSQNGIGINGDVQLTNQYLRRYYQPDY